MESSKLFYFAARVQQVKLKGKNATHWEHDKEPSGTWWEHIGNMIKELHIKKGTLNTIGT
jgi:hypothetical protein